MSGDAPQASPAPKLHTRTFRRYDPSKRPTPEQLQRQDAVLQHAWRTFGDSTAVIAFLNTHHEELDRQPLSLAIESDEGLLRVRGLLGEIKRPA